MKINPKFLISILFLLTFSIVFTTCNPSNCDPGQSTRSEGCDQFKRVNSTVYKGSSSSSTLPVFSQSGWYPLQSGDAISTNSSGMAELNFSGCWPGQLFCFKDSSLDFQVATCNKVTYKQTPMACVPNGAVYSNGPCPGEYAIHTGSARIEKTGTVLSITYLPDRRDVTLVLVLEGSATVNPVAQQEPLVFASESDVERGQFYFTMPDDQLSPIGGLEPRQVYPLPELPPVVEQLGIFDWMIQVREQAQQDDVLPGDWPPEIGGPGTDSQPPPQGPQIVVLPESGPFEDPLVQEALMLSVPWGEIAGQLGRDDLQITGFIDDEPIDLLPDYPYDPDKARELLAEAGYPGGFGMPIFFSPVDPRLGRVAELMTKYLGVVGFDTGVNEMPPDFDIISDQLRESGEGFVVLDRGN